MSRNRMEEVVGGVGSVAITGTGEVSAPTGYYIFCFVVLSDVIVNTQSNTNGSTNCTLSGFASIPTGTPIYGKYDSITLTSGEAIGYLAPK